MFKRSGDENTLQGCRKFRKTSALRNFRGCEYAEGLLRAIIGLSSKRQCVGICHCFLLFKKIRERLKNYIFSSQK